MDFASITTRRLDEIISILSSIQRSGMTLNDLKEMAMKRRRGIETPAIAADCLNQICPECHTPMVSMGMIGGGKWPRQPAWLCPKCLYERIGMPRVRRVSHIVKKHQKGVVNG